MKSQRSPLIKISKSSGIHKKQRNFGKIGQNMLSCYEFGGYYDYKIQKRGTCLMGRKQLQKLVDLTLKQEDSESKILNDIQQIEPNKVKEFMEESKKESFNDITEISMEAQSHQECQIELSSKAKSISNRYPQRARAKPFKYWLGERYIYKKGKIIGLSTIQ